MRREERRRRTYDRGVDAAPVALVTGVSRRIGIGRAVAERLSADGFRVIAAGWRPYDRRMPWGADPDDSSPFTDEIEVDLEDPDGAAAMIPGIAASIGPVEVLVLAHCESVDSDIASTTVECFDRPMAVIARATWLLIRAYADQFTSPGGIRRIISITSDHTAGNLPYGASKGAMDRIVLAAAVELAELGVTANVVNPGATDTGWMDDEIERAVRRRNLQARIGTPGDVANLVAFLCSPKGQWINGQLIHSDGGLSPG